MPGDPCRARIAASVRSRPVGLYRVASPPVDKGGVDSREAQMLSKISIRGAVAAILMLPTALSAQGVGGAVNPGAAVRSAVVGYPDHDLRRRRSLHRHTAPTKPRRRQ